MPLTVRLSHIRKTFARLVALDDVSLTLSGGRVHGLLGENGAGKTTLMNVLYGLLRADAGEIFIDEAPAALRNPREALAAGIGMVHQHFMLAGAMTVLDNVLLGDRRQNRWLPRQHARGQFLALAQRLGLLVDPDARIESLSVGQQQRVEILKALFREARLLILDEPTAVLTPAEATQLFQAVRRLRDEGKAIVFISHKLAEVKEICDELTVLRRGRVVWDGPASSVTPAELARQMIGREVRQISLERTENLDELDAAATGIPVARPQGANAAAPMALELRDVSAGPLREVSLQIRRGEMLGIAGVDGNGQQELAEAIVGLRPIAAGQVMLDGTDAAGRQRQIAHIPNDRQREALIGSMSVAENIQLKRHDHPPFAHWGLSRPGAARAMARKLAERFDIRPRDVSAPVSSLSGGNQQKVVLARELGLAEPAWVLAMNPVRGLDIAATNFVYQQLLTARARGAAILLISSELDELRRLCDRIAVLYGGRLTPTDFPRDHADQIGKLMMGLSA